MTLSAGVASYSPGLTKEALIELADGALYRAKRKGRNRVCFAGENLGGVDLVAAAALLVV